MDPGPEFENLLPGDLCFFAEDPGRVTHVVMTTGGPRIIHASLGNGGVARNDIIGRRSYEQELRRLFHNAAPRGLIPFHPRSSPAPALNPSPRGRSPDSFGSIRISSPKELSPALSTATRKYACV